MASSFMKAGCTCCSETRIGEPEKSRETKEYIPQIIVNEQHKKSGYSCAYLIKHYAMKAYEIMDV
jgi:hypothetical protein